LQISSPVAAAAATTKYSSSQLQKPSTKKQQKTGDNGLMVIVIPRLNPFLVLCFPSHSCSSPVWIHFWSSVFRLMPSFFLIAVHPQFEPIFGPLFSVWYPVLCCPQSVK
jgi:hypothetical protein